MALDINNAMHRAMAITRLMYLRKAHSERAKTSRDKKRKAYDSDVVNAVELALVALGSKPTEWEAL